MAERLEMLGYSVEVRGSEFGLSQPVTGKLYLSV